MNTITGVGANSRYVPLAVPKTGTASFSDALNSALGYTKSAAESQPAPGLTELNTSLRTASAEERHAYYQTLPFEQVGEAMERDAEQMLQRIEGAMQVPIGKNELPEFMAEMEKALADGASLKSVLQKQIDKHTADDGSRPGSLGTNGMDILFIDPNTGEIKEAFPRINEPRDFGFDDNCVWDLAFDLHEFIMLRFFKNDDDNSEEIDRLIEDIKARQENKNYDRFDNQEEQL